MNLYSRSALISVLIFCLVSYSGIEAYARPNLSVTVSSSAVDVEWDMKVYFEDITSFIQKAEEFHSAQKNNYDDNFQKQVSKYLTSEFSEFLNRPNVTVEVTYLSVEGDGDYWSSWMKTTIHFTIKGLNYIEGNSQYIDMRWLTISLRKEKYSFEDRKNPQIVYAFYPKYLLAMNWKDYFNWDLTARSSETTDEGILLTLPCRRKYEPYEEYPEVYAEPERPQLQILVKNKQAAFESNRIRIPLPPQPPTIEEILKPYYQMLGLAGSIVTLGAIGWITISRAYSRKRQHELSRRKGQMKAIKFSEKIQQSQNLLGLPKRTIYGGKGDFKVKKKKFSEDFLALHDFKVKPSLWQRLKRIVNRFGRR